MSMGKLQPLYEVELADELRRCEQSNCDCENCPVRHNRETCTILSDAASLIEKYLLSEQGHRLRTSELQVELSLERFHRDRLNKQVESMQQTFRELGILVNESDGDIVCEHQLKNRKPFDFDKKHSEIMS